MDNPNYVIKTHEAVLTPVNQNSGLRFLKIGVWIVVAIVVIGSFVFRINLFSELSWTARILLIVVAIRVTFLNGKKEYIPSLMELQFYDSYIIIYRPKRYYSRKVTRMEINKMLYSNITKCIYKSNSKRLHIYGNVDATWYNYDANGVVSSTPTYSRMVTNTLCYLSTRCAQDVDFKTEIETHSPIKVIIENS